MRTARTAIEIRSQIRDVVGGGGRRSLDRPTDKFFPIHAAFLTRIGSTNVLYTFSATR
jgi:hypothetical protein